MLQAKARCTELAWQTTTEAVFINKKETLDMFQNKATFVARM